MRFSLTRISFDNGNYAFAEELSLMPANPFWAARAARMQGKMEEARRYFRAYVSNAPGNGDIPNLAFFREAREYFSGDELEELLLPLTEKFGGDVPLLIRTFIAKEKGDNAFVENVYKKSKRKLARFRRRKIPDYEDMEASAEHSYERRDLENEHAELCEVLGRFDEAAEFYLRDLLNGHLLLYEPFSAWVETRDDKEMVYERVFRNLFSFSAQSFVNMAMAAEKLHQDEKARKYYAHALEQEERRFDFAEAFKIAQKLGFEERARDYVDVPTYLYEHGHI